MQRSQRIHGQEEWRRSRDDVCFVHAIIPCWLWNLSAGLARAAFLGHRKQLRYQRESAAVAKWGPAAMVAVVVIAGCALLSTLSLMIQWAKAVALISNI